MKNITRFTIPIACIAALSLTGCATMEWRSAPKPAVIKELQGVKSMGVFSFKPLLKPFGRILIKTERTYYMAVSIDWLKQKVAFLYTSPEAITDFYVNADNLAWLCSQTAAWQIGGDGFDYSVWKSGVNSRLMGGPLPDAPAQPIEEPTQGFDSVVPVTETFIRGAMTPEKVIDLGAKYGVDVLLGFESTVIGEIGLVTDQQSTWDYGKPVPIGNHVLLAHVFLDWVLYDAKTGAKITDSNATAPQFSTVMDPMDTIVDLGIKDLDELNAFLARSYYLTMFKEPFEKALAPYLSLFRPLYVATLHEVKKEPAAGR